MLPELSRGIPSAGKLQKFCGNAPGMLSEHSGCVPERSRSSPNNEIRPLECLRSPFLTTLEYQACLSAFEINLCFHVLRRCRVLAVLSINTRCPGTRKHGLSINGVTFTISQYCETCCEHALGMQGMVNVPVHVRAAAAISSVTFRQKPVCAQGQCRCHASCLKVCNTGFATSSATTL
jgi:hypothetical protein